MNKIYRVIRNHLGQFIAVSENSKASKKSKKTLVSAVSIALGALFLSGEVTAATTDETPFSILSYLIQGYMRTGVRPFLGKEQI